MDYKILEDGKSVLLPEPRLTDLPSEILQSIFWFSLELNLCHVSKDMRRKLPSYTRTTLFLTLVAFGPRRLHDRILRSQGTDCSDVIGQLDLRLPLSPDAQLDLQKRFFNSGWLNLNVCMAALQQSREHHIQARWVEKGNSVVPASLQAFEEHHRHSNGRLTIHGTASKGHNKRLIIGELHVAIDSHISQPHEDNICRWSYECFNLLDVLYIPDRLLSGPLPWPQVPGGYPMCRLYDYSILHSKPSLLNLLWAAQHEWACRPLTAQPRHVEAQPSLVDSAVMGAITEGYILALKMLLDTRYAKNGALYSITLTRQDFILAAQRRNTLIIFVMLMTGRGMIPIDHKDVAQWISKVHEDANPLGAHGCPCLLVKYIKYLKEKKAVQGTTERFFAWKHDRENWSPSHDPRVASELAKDTAEEAVEGDSVAKNSANNDGVDLARLGGQLREVCGLWRP
ncbi:hypothetical protein EPUS_00813 [Endocarpon pusillum Z07020]|uniref:Uncharacterized protein n=1 Tax=Endocarpon pusillum (strain Z07020 / HMAS-L-300199) TaxID=1263415 RepID=U1GQT0_ENDPU|nr:uncharacterized protein EPUS_00813 [Endocarpon pusillum Z07020]ERF74683.1 hypothetical protein EPUS_00813 [Endocarpon pusillum Z07020]